MTDDTLTAAVARLRDRWEFAAIDAAMKGEGDGATAAQADAPPAPCARRYALAECRDIQANGLIRKHLT